MVQWNRIFLCKGIGISKTLRPSGIGNFKDLLVQWYQKFQRPSCPMVSEILQILWPNGIGYFKDLALWPNGIGNHKDLMVIEIILVKQRSLKFPMPLDYGH